MLLPEGRGAVRDADTRGDTGELAHDVDRYSASERT